MAKSDLQRVLDGMTAKTPDYDKYWQYYNGDAPLIYSTEKLGAISLVRSKGRTSGQMGLESL